jgi:hypothetical protein
MGLMTSERTPKKIPPHCCAAAQQQPQNGPQRKRDVVAKRQLQNGPQRKRPRCIATAHRRLATCTQRRKQTKKPSPFRFYIYRLLLSAAAAAFSQQSLQRLPTSCSSDGQAVSLCPCGPASLSWSRNKTCRQAAAIYNVIDPTRHSLAILRHGHYGHTATVLHSECRAKLHVTTMGDWGFLTRVGFEILTAVVKKSTIFWDIGPCSPLSVNRRFGGTYRLRLQGRKN